MQYFYCPNIMMICRESFSSIIVPAFRQYLLCLFLLWGFEAGSVIMVYGDISVESNLVLSCSFVEGIFALRGEFEFSSV